MNQVKLLLRIGLLGLLLGLESMQLSLADLGEDRILEILADPTRPAEARIRDVWRKPASVLRFSQIEPAMRILEIAPAGGYYTALLSRIVGEDGTVFAVDPARIFEYFPQGREGYQKYQAQDPRSNVQYSIQNLDEIEISGKVDQIWMVLYYHDTLWTGEDRVEMNRRLFEVLKPGGSLILLDHHGLAGSGAEVAQTLHRMDAAIAEEELTGAGFVIEARSDGLLVGHDPRNDSVFGEDRRGNTDRFLWRLRKP